MKQSEAHDLSRLRWRCRSGLRELDELLIRYIDNGYAQAPPAQRQAFERLLELSTPDLLDQVLGRSPSAGAEERQVLDVIRNSPVY